MKIETYKLIHKYQQDQFNLPTEQRFHLEHLLYEKLIKLAETSKWNNIGFLHTYKDDLDCYAVIDELIKQKRTVYLSEFTNHKLLFNQVDSMFNSTNSIDGYLKFEDKNYLSDTLQVVIVNVQGYTSSNQGLVYEEEFFNFLKEFKGTKVAYVNKKYLVEQTMLTPDVPVIKFDRIITI